MIGLLKGLQATMSHLFSRNVTVQYPEVRRELPQRSRGLIRLRLKDDARTPRCIACTFCEQVCPAVAIKIIYDDVRAGKVWSFDAGAGPMLSCFNRGEKPLGIAWPAGSENGGAADAADSGAAPEGCIASSLLDAAELTEAVLTRTALKNGVWLSQVFAIATFYEQLGPGKPAKKPDGEPPAARVTAEGCPPILLGDTGAVDPENIDSYAGAGGYQAVTRTLTEMSPAEVIDELSISGLRGRSGSGFPVGRKWKLAAETEAPQKYVICNAEEGDPGSVKDRVILEENPHAVIEGLIVAGYATGASEGYIYIGVENATAAARIRKAVEQARERGLLGKELPGTDFRFSVTVVEVPRAFMGGEETALIATLEGRRPMPSPRPPYPAEKGLRGMPTVVDNVETLATVPWIINNGARAFQQIGAANAPGTKLFTLRGAVARPGVYEATLDTSLKKLATDEAGGFTGTPRAALVGSLGGGFLSPGLFDIPLDFDSISETGGDLSSGTISVLGDADCVVDVVRQSLAFFSRQSCGKCVPCRLGNWRLLEIMEKICAGQGSEADIGLAADLAADIRDGALCGLGRGAVRPLLTGLKFFRDEFIRHAAEGSCSAGKCNMDGKESKA